MLSQSNNRSLISALWVLLLILFISCGSPKLPAPGEPGSAELYELAWVHPRILVSEPQFTLITAERVDSFLVARGSEIKSSAPTLVFRIAGGEDCQTTINLLEAFGGYHRPLLSQPLGPGSYKLSLNIDLFSDEELPPGRYHLIARTCQGETRVTFFRN